MSRSHSAETTHPPNYTPHLSHLSPLHSTPLFTVPFDALLHLITILCVFFVLTSINSHLHLHHLSVQCIHHHPAYYPIYSIFNDIIHCLNYYLVIVLLLVFIYEGKFCDYTHFQLQSYSSSIKTIVVLVLRVELIIQPT